MPVRPVTPVRHPDRPYWPQFSSVSRTLGLACLGILFFVGEHFKLVAASPSSVPLTDGRNAKAGVAAGILLTSSAVRNVRVLRHVSSIASGQRMFAAAAGPLPARPAAPPVRPAHRPGPQRHESSTMAGLPSVSVPVLSKIIAFSRWARSRDSTSLIRMPDRAAAPVPVMIAVGVASPSAHGHAMTSTEIGSNQGRIRKRRWLAGTRPRKGNCRDHHNNGHEDIELMQVNEPLDRRFSGLGIFNEVDNLGQG